MSYDLSNLVRPVVVFEIDQHAGVSAFRTAHQFSRFIDQRAAIGQIVHPVEQGMGSYKGEVSVCYVMALADFEANKGLIERYAIAKQESVMTVDCERVASLIYGAPFADCGMIVELGKIARVKADEVWAYDGYTFLASGFYAV